MSAREDQVLALLHKFRPQKHYRASREAGRARYAVYSDDGQLTEPKLHSEAQAEADAMVAAAIMKLWE